MFHFEWPGLVQVGPVETFNHEHLTLLGVGMKENKLVAPSAWQVPLEESFQLALDRQSGEFKASVGQLSLLALSATQNVLLVGLGDLSSLQALHVRRAFCQAGRYALKLQKNKLQLDLPYESASLSKATFLETAVEGLLLAQDPVGHQKALRTLESIAWQLDLGTLPKTVLERNQLILLARRMINANADEMTPSCMAQIAQELCKKVNDPSCICEVLDEKQLASLGMNLLLAVGQAARTPPRLIVLSYFPKSKTEQAPFLIVGKGISYDTGGLKLKTAEGMLEMRCDMAGAAVALSTFMAHVQAQAPKPLVAVLVCAENAIGSGSFKLGDVVLSHAKKSVEITNTDAEGRLVLADALSYAIDRFKPRQVVDVATLTSAASIALGSEAACLMSEDETLVQELMKASERTAERLWRMPLYEEYLETLKSDVADIKNSGSRFGASSIAAIFIKQFVPQGLPWAHLDIAPVAFLDKEKGVYSKLATGFGVRLLVDWLNQA